MSHPRLNQLLQAELDRRAGASLLRTRIHLESIDAVHVRDGQRVLVNFAANNYLGLTHHPAVVEKQKQGLDFLGAGGGASPLVSGQSWTHTMAERLLALHKRKNAAVLLPSGYQAAHAAVQTLAALGKVRFLVDKLAHASLIDAIGGVKAEFRIFPHNHLHKLGRLLAEADTNQFQVVVTESIFSMDGDAADLAGLAELKREHEFVLLLDEAHGTGVYGEWGEGYAAERGFAALPDVVLVTFSKAMGLAGAALCGTREFCDGVINWGRAYIYSTALPPATAHALVAALGVMRKEPQRQSRVRTLATRVRGAVGLTGDSPIVPIVLASERAALDAAEDLRAQGMLVVAIRPPTVPRGTSRLRVTLSCEHTDEEVARLIDALSEYRNVK